MWWRAFAKFLKNKKCYKPILCKRDNGPVSLYLERFYIFKCRYIEIMLHRFHKGDDRLLHDHPWRSFSFILEGGYKEWLLDKEGKEYYKIRKPGYFTTRPATGFHRIELLKNYKKNEQVWTLFITLKRERAWGFIKNNKWIHNKVYLSSQPDLNRKSPKYLGYLFPKVIYSKNEK